MDFICIVTGPSLTEEDCDRARQARATVIAVNDAYRLCPNADYLYACDQAWWKVHIDDIRKTFTG